MTAGYVAKAKVILRQMGVDARLLDDVLNATSSEQCSAALATLAAALERTRKAEAPS
jgi:hypothetical protein